jgi:hypothetical protein
MEDLRSWTFYLFVAVFMTLPDRKSLSFVYFFFFEKMQQKCWTSSDKLIIEWVLNEFYSILELNWEFSCKKNQENSEKIKLNVN